LAADERGGTPMKDKAMSMAESGGRGGNKTPAEADAAG